MKLVPQSFAITFSRRELAQLIKKNKERNAIQRALLVMPIVIETRGSDAWAVARLGMTLTRMGRGKFEWEYEPLPSSRTDAYIKRARYATPQAALAAVRKYYGL